MNPPAVFKLGLDDCVFDKDGRFTGWHLALNASDFLGGFSTEKLIPRLKKTDLGTPDGLALRTATKDLARRLVLGQVRAEPARELRRVQFGYSEKDSLAGVSGLFIYSDAEDLPGEVQELVAKVKAIGYRLPPDEQKERSGQSVPLTAWFRLQQRTRAEDGSAKEWVKTLDVTAHEDKVETSRAPGKAEPLAFLASTDRERFKLAVVDLAAKIVQDRMEGIRSDKAGDNLVQIGFHWRNVDITAHFHYSSEDAVAKAMSDILSALPKEIPSKPKAVQCPPEVF